MKVSLREIAILSLLTGLWIGVGLILPRHANHVGWAVIAVLIVGMWLGRFMPVALAKIDGMLEEGPHS